VYKTQSKSRKNLVKPNPNGMSQINPMKPGGGKMELRKQKRKITSEAKPKRTSETREKCRDNDVVSTTGCH